jgi:hypothetical protein
MFFNKIYSFINNTIMSYSEKNVNTPVHSKYLVLDLDHTLIYTHTDSNQNFDCILDLSESNERDIYDDYDAINNFQYLCIRPYAISFLRNLSKHYNLIVWSAGGYRYIEQIIKILFFDNNIPLYLYLDGTFCEQCNESTHPQIKYYLALNNLNVEYAAGINHKPLRKLQDILNYGNLATFNKTLRVPFPKSRVHSEEFNNVNHNEYEIEYNCLSYCGFFNANVSNFVKLDDIKIVDNLYVNFIDNPLNGIRVEDFYGNIHDRELIDIETKLLIDVIGE